MMTLQNDENYTNLSFLIEDFAGEVEIHKTVVERTIAAGQSVCPMIVFFTDAKQKDYLIVLSDQDSFEATLPKLSEALHFYAARKSHSVLVMLTSDLAIDNVIYKSLNFFVASSSAAYVFYLPYTMTDSQEIIWHHDKAIIDTLENLDVDQNGTDFIHLLHAQVHVEDSPFEPAEVLNYLSYNGFAIQSLNENNVVPYIDMSTFDYQPIAYPS